MTFSDLEVDLEFTFSKHYPEPPSPSPAGRYCISTRSAPSTPSSSSNHLENHAYVFGQDQPMSAPPLDFWQSTGKPVATRKIKRLPALSQSAPASVEVDPQLGSASSKEEGDGVSTIPQVTEVMAKVLRTVPIPKPAKISQTKKDGSPRKPRARRTPKATSEPAMSEDEADGEEEDHIQKDHIARPPKLAS